MLAIWQYNKVTGYWKHTRAVEPETMDQWLDIFQKDEPSEHFKVSKKRPSKKPEG